MRATLRVVIEITTLLALRSCARGCPGSGWSIELISLESFSEAIDIWEQDSTVDVRPSNANGCGMRMTQYGRWADPSPASCSVICSVSQQSATAETR